MRETFPGLKFVIFIVFATLVSALLVFEIGNIDPFADRRSFQAEFVDATGLIANDAVKVAGVTVGKVTNVEVTDGRLALVTFEVDNTVEVTEDSLLAVRWRDLFGLRFLYLDPGVAPAVDAGFTFPDRQTTSPVDLARLLDRITPVISALDPELQNQVLQSLAEALVGREQEVQEIIADGAALTQTIASRDVEIGNLLINAGNLLDAYANREQELRGLLDSFVQVSQTLATRNQVLDRAVVGINEGMTELGEFVDTNDDEIRLLLDELEQTTDVLSTRRDLLERVVQTTGRGIVSYHRISRLGQWFDVRAVGLSVNYDPATNLPGAELPVMRAGTGGGAAAAGFADFFDTNGGSR